METGMILLLIVFAYLLGSVPFGLIIGKYAAGTDVRQLGSGNIGATNVGRMVGKKWGLITLLADMAKGILPLALAARFLTGSEKELWLGVVGLAAFLGHLFPVYLKAKGGKGVATAFGVFLFLSPPAALLDVLFFVAALILSRYVSVASLTAATALPFLVYRISSSRPYFIAALIVAVLVWIRHHSNLRRLFSSQEKKWK